MKIHSFTKNYQNRTVLTFPDFSLKEGTIYAVIGANGSGKSTFAKILSGVVSSDTPTASIWDTSFSIGYLPQKPYVFHMSLWNNLMQNAGSDKKTAEERAASLIASLELASLRDKKAITLSGGETARMNLARLMMKDYPLLILDEPCAAMDIPSTLKAESLIQDYSRTTGATVLIITHSLQQAKRLADQVLFFDRGTLCEQGSTEQVLRSPIHAETRQFLDFFYHI